MYSSQTFRKKITKRTEFSNIKPRIKGEKSGGGAFKLRCDIHQYFSGIDPINKRCYELRITLRYI